MMRGVDSYRILLAAHKEHPVDRQTSYDFLLLARRLRCVSDAATPRRTYQSINQSPFSDNEACPHPTKKKRE